MCRVFFNLSKAFDSVNIKFVEIKLFAMGIRGVVLELILSFLRGRRIYVSVGGADSSAVDVDFGVAQGSVLGPLIYLLFISDINSHLSADIVVNYADDTSVVISAVLIADLQLRVDQVCSEMEQWCTINGLITNKQKSVFVQFFCEQYTQCGYY